MHHTRFWLWAIAIILCLGIFINLPEFQIKLDKFGVNFDRTFGGYSIDWNVGNWRFTRDLSIKKGLDLAGGVRAVLQADMSGIAEQDRMQALDSAQLVIERRVNFLGVTEPKVYSTRSGNEYRLVVEIPGISDTDVALGIIGQTAQLMFREIEGEYISLEDAVINDKFKDTELTGKFLNRAYVNFAQAPQGGIGGTTGEPQIRLTFTDEGAALFEDITSRNVGKPLAMFLDEAILSAPFVNEPISGGEAIVSGGFTVEQAQLLVRQLNAGALPISVSVVEQEVIEATLGEESVQKSIIAGLVGLLLVVVFMIANYGRLGIIAAVALTVYAVVTLSAYRIIPVTLTLSGIAGFILSIGMAVDSNILIFERMKEELRAGRPLHQAMELGFGRAWDSIRDANVATLITVFVLFNPFNWSFLVTSGVVRGFALTLGIGIAISLFTGIIVSRTLVRVFYRTGAK